MNTEKLSGSDAARGKAGEHEVTYYLDSELKKLPDSRRPRGRFRVLRKHRFRRFLYSGALLVVGAALGVLFAFQYLGLPEQVKTRLTAELEQRGVVLGIGSLYLAPFGGVEARDVRIFQTRENSITRIRVDRVRFAFNWLSWWRGNPFLSEAMVEDAEIAIPLDGEGEASLKGVRAEVELLPGRLMVESAQASVGEVSLHLRGVIHLDGPPPPVEGGKRGGSEGFGKAWEKVQRELDKLSAPVTVNIEFEAPSSSPLDAEGRIQVQSSRTWWEGVLIHEADIVASYHQRILKLEQCRILAARGGIQASGFANLNEKKASLSLRSDMDFSLFHTLLPSSNEHLLKSLLFERLPVIKGLAEFDWSDPENKSPFFCRAQVDWKDFMLYEESTRSEWPFSQMRAIVSFDGKRLMVTDFLLSGSSGKVEMDVLKGAEGELSGKVVSSLDPTCLRPMFGPRPPAVLSNIAFHEKGPEIEATLSGNINDVNSLKAEGSLRVTSFDYTNGEGGVSSLALAESPFRFESRRLYLDDLKVMRVHGEEGTGKVVYDFNKRHVTITNARTHMDVQKTVPLFGGKLPKYVAPYRFIAPPHVEINGLVDLANETETDLTVKIRSSEGMKYTFLGKELTVTNINTKLEFKGKSFHIDISKPTTLFSGSLYGTMDLDLSQKGPPYQTRLKWEEMKFLDILATYFDKKDTTGTCNGEAVLSGRLDQIESITGTGELNVLKGDVYQIPFLGPFSELLGGVIPNLGYSKADRAETKFRFDSGVIHIEDVKIRSTAFVVSGGGTYDYIKDYVDLSMRANVQGPFGIPFFLFSKLFEYRGYGSLSETKWEPKIF